MKSRQTDVAERKKELIKIWGVGKKRAADLVAAGVCGADRAEVGQRHGGVPTAEHVLSADLGCVQEFNRKDAVVVARHRRPRRLRRRLSDLAFTV